HIDVAARCLVNAAGPWAFDFLQSALPAPHARALRLIKGSHIVVPRLFAHDHAYLFQHPDGRIVFAIPYEQAFTLIGTTDLDYQGDPDKVAIDAGEIAYLCQLASRYFAKPVAPADVVWTYSGVRPLLADEADDPKAVTRNYRFELDREGDGDCAPMLSIFGGKLTTFRKLAEEAVNLLAPLLGNRHGAWTANACLPGGDLFGATPQNRSVLEFDDFVLGLQRRHAWLPAALVARYARAYGTRIERLLSGRGDLAAMGGEILPGLFAAEVGYLREHEWAVSAEDILWRRSKLGLHLPPDSAARLDAWLAQHRLP
ncbi:MAG: glycerol-3-phosphate dehydrogenase, partial [Burkholderiaceae bacterium]|nr:glycerol-3-phosphate dehydrogenase [Burkholderiaceae bacterium]